MPVLPLATHEDIDKLVDQVRAVTQTTKEIEARISNEVWDRQKLWEMKREVVFDAMKRVVQADNALLSFACFLTWDRQRAMLGRKRFTTRPSNGATPQTLWMNRVWSLP
jgi:hypothetical protein